MNARTRHAARALAGLGVLLVASAALAEVVPIGRHVQLRAGATQRHAYSTWRGDARRTGRSRARVPKAAPSRLWATALPQRRLVPPAVLADGTLLVGGTGGVQALDARTGARRWFAAVGAVRFTPTITPEGSALVAASGKLFLIDPQGQVRELAQPFEVGDATLLLESEEIVIPGRRGGVHALGLDGTHLGSAPAPNRQWTALVSGDLIAAGGGQRLSLLSPQDGSARTLDLPEQLAASPVTGDDEVIWALGERGVVLHVAPSGELREVARLGHGGFAGAPALGWDGALRAGLQHGEIVCIEPSGRERWRRGIDSWPGPLVMDADDTALVLSVRGTLYAIDRRGELLWRKGLGTFGKAVLGHDGTIYVALRSGVVEAWR